MKRYLAIATTLAFLFLLTWQAHAQESLPKLVKTIQPAVVTVFAYDPKGKLKGQGSGFFINQEGHFITNYHVLRGAFQAEVETSDGGRYSVNTVVAEDKASDLVIATILTIEDFDPPSSMETLKATPQIHLVIPKKALVPKKNTIHSLKISAVRPEVGERVAVVGSPMGLEQTLSEGVVSAIRHIPDFGEILQITAPISRGSSGSPVVNMKGEVGGVATFLLKEGQNLNFAVPGNRALALKPGVGRPLNEWEVAGPPEPIPEADVLFEQGSKLFDAGKLEKAIEAYKQAIRLNPDFAEVHLKLGNAYRKLKRYKKAVESYKNAIRLNPDDANAHHGLGLSFSDQGRFREAEAAFKQTIRLNPDHVNAHLLLGVVYGEQGRIRESIMELQMAIKLKPDYILPHYTLGQVYLSINDKAAALEEYKILKGLDPKIAEDLFNQIYE